MIELEVKDMTCDLCVDTITRVIKETEPAASVSIDLANHRVRVDGVSGADTLIRVIREVGYSPVLKS